MPGPPTTTTTPATSPRSPARSPRPTWPPTRPCHRPHQRPAGVPRLCRLGAGPARGRDRVGSWIVVDSESARRVHRRPRRALASCPAPPARPPRLARRRRPTTSPGTDAEKIRARVSQMWLTVAAGSWCLGGRLRRAARRRASRRRRGPGRRRRGRVGVGERAVGRLQAQAVRQAARAIGEAGAAIDVEQLEPDEQAAGALADRLLQLLRGNLLVEGERQVEIARRVPARRPSSAPAWPRRPRTTDRSSSRIATRSAIPEGVEHVGSDLADGADRLPARRRASPDRVGWSPAGTRCWSMRAPIPSGGELAATRQPPRRLGAGEDHAEHLALIGELTGARWVDVADLEQRHTGASMRFVEGHGPEQPGTQRRTQDVLVGDERVGDPQHRAVEAGAARGRRRRGTATASPRRSRGRGAPHEPAGDVAGPR